MAKILIIDDEKSIRSTLREILEYEKYEVDEAAGRVGRVWKKLSNKRFNRLFAILKCPKWME